MKYLLISLLFSIFGNIASAKDIKYSNGEVSAVIPFEVLDGKLQAEPVTFVFPADISSIKNKSLFEITPVDAEQFGYSRLNIRPLFKSGNQKVHFVLSDESVIRVNIRITSTLSNTDVIYRFLPREALPDKKSKAPEQTDLLVMKGLLSGASVVGMAESSNGPAVSCRIWGLSVSMQTVYTGTEFKGYKLKLANSSSDKVFKLELLKIYFKGQDLNRSLLIHATNYELVPKKYGINESILTILADPNVLLRDLHLCDEGEQVLVSKFERKE